MRLRIQNVSIEVTLGMGSVVVYMKVGIYTAFAFATSLFVDGLKDKKSVGGRVVKANTILTIVPAGSPGFP